MRAFLSMLLVLSSLGMNARSNAETPALTDNLAKAFGVDRIFEPYDSGLTKALPADASVLYVIDNVLEQKISGDLFNELERDPEGNVLHLNQQAAREHCLAKNRRLPTARELAEYSMGSGAKGISEIAQGIPDSSYRFINAENLDGGVDNFYFSYEGYIAKVGEAWHSDLEQILWSSSLNLDQPGFAFYFYVGNGFLSRLYPRYGIPFVCVRGSR